jgi:hypothetical protein
MRSGVSRADVLCGAVLLLLVLVVLADAELMFDTTSLNFGDVKVGQKAAREFRFYVCAARPCPATCLVCVSCVAFSPSPACVPCLHPPSDRCSQNHSAVSVYYQFHDDNLGTFRFDRTHGVLGGGLSQIVTVRFAPTAPLNFFKRVFCLVNNHTPLVRAKLPGGAGGQACRVGDVS